jgi:aspartyl-tRNA(Asn)/glutamyl-tRNA(Gln) amidotransferase subunit A
MDLSKLTIKSVAKAFRSGELKVAELAQYYLDQIKSKNANINAYLEIYDDVMDQAAAAQARIDAGEEGELIGIPMGIKDNILIEGKISTAASKILENYKATYTATAAQKLIDAGVVFLGRANMDEFAMGGSTENSAYGPTKNPVDTNRVPGGSSGGSAAAVAMNGALASIGSDTGGSIRQPASFCGVVGLKPTYGSVSRHGLMAMASSLDVIGPLTKNVEDAEIIFNTISGKDLKDSTTSESDDQSSEVKKIGVPYKYLQKDGIDEDVLDNFNKSIEKLKSAGYEIVDIDLPNLDHSLAVYYVLMPAEVSSNMARYDGVKYGQKVDGDNLVQTYFKTRGALIGPEVKRRIMLGTYVLSAGYADEYYKKAWMVRNLIKSDFAKAYEQVDVIAMPTSPTPAFKIGEKSDPLQMYLADIFTISANLAGVPAISIPEGFVEREGAKLPTGLQLIAPHFGEAKLFELGKKFEIIE